MGNKIIKKAEETVLAVWSNKASKKYRYGKNKETGRYEQGEVKGFTPASLSIETRTEWVNLEIDEAKRLVKALKKAINEAEASNSKELS